VIALGKVSDPSAGAGGTAPAPPIIREQAAMFGPNQGLCGIATAPAPGTAAAGLPAVILLNAGFVHRVGPHRLTVNLARRLARAGFHAFRFDASGLGDSRGRSGSSFEETAVQDIRTAMDHVQQTTGIDRFILGGLCAGADNSLRTAPVDPRVVGIALLDPYAYRTPGFYLRYYLARAGQLQSWKGAIRRYSAALYAAARARLRGESSDGGGQESNPRLRQYSRQAPPREVFADSLRKLLDRGTRIFIAYSGSMEGVYNYPGQFDDAFRRDGLAGRVDCIFFDDANHTYTELTAQRRLADALVHWAQGARKA
jgi:hypothetical protein